MGIIIILAVLCAISITITIVGCEYWDFDFLGFLFGFLSVVFAFGAIGCSIACVCVQAKENTEIYRLEQEREALVESYNTYYDNYDKDLAHSKSLKEIRAEIAEFNAIINKNNYFCNNFFVNWFYIDCNDIEPITITNGTAD